MRHINQAGIDLIKQFEGCVLTAYKDAVGIWTIGYGHTGKDVHEGLTIDSDAANAILAVDLNKFETGVDECLTNREVSDAQFSALVCFAFNAGLANLNSSHLINYVNSGDYSSAVAEFGKWNHARKQVLVGLTKRRAAEAALFQS